MLGDLRRCRLSDLDAKMETAHLARTSQQYAAVAVSMQDVHTSSSALNVGDVCLNDESA